MSWLKKHKPQMSFYRLWLVFLGLSIFISALLVIKVSHNSRALFSKYHSLQLIEQNQHDELGRLQLQEGSESSSHDLAIKAKDELGMFAPGLMDRLYLK